MAPKAADASPRLIPDPVLDFVPPFDILVNLKY
jgi:hypothetical protein